MGRHTDMVNMELLTVSEDKQCKWKNEVGAYPSTTQAGQSLTYDLR